ncbi:MAG TPA: radical SAM protein [Thermodesulfovibrionales bacterium]|nr:radical SAM protein [Thermodesulfovibrionales bacterium]
MASRKILKKIASLLAAEKGTIHKEPGGKVNVCLVYPNTYHIGMSSLGFQGIYTLLNERHDVVCERAFLPDEGDREEYIRTGTEIFSMESGRPLNRFQIVAFSVSFENDYPHIPAILAMSKIPFRREERSGNHPLLVVGGVCASFNPEPIADFFDVCFIGEAEETLPEFIEAFRHSDGREDLLARVDGIEGLYLPGLYTVSYSDGRIADRTASGSAPERVKRRFVRDISSHSFRQSIITPETEFSSMYLLEAMRGCPWSCRFCVAGSVYKPVRKKDPATLTREIRDSRSVTARVGLIGPSLTDYPPIRDVLCIDGVDFSITSLRASPLSAELIGFLKGHRSVSIAPESGTERLRRVIDKRITEEDILETSRLILSAGVDNLRLYFMVGLPTEDEQDIEGIITLVRKIRDGTPRGNIVLTLSTFVPKPFTPFQWHPMEKAEVVKRRLHTIKKALIPVKGVKVFHDVPKYAYMQGLFARGDRRVSRVLEGMADNHDWQNACKKAGLNADFYLFTQRELGEILPWDFIDNGISKDRIWSEYQKAIAGGRGWETIRSSKG